MDKTYKILITTYPFGITGREPLELLEKTGWDITLNPYNRRLKPMEVPDLIKGYDAILAGTEPYPEEALKGSNVKVISRVGIGLDNVPIKTCEKLGIKVTYTPEAPSQGVAELTVANIINLSRFILQSDHSVREGVWNRYMGFLLNEITIGLVGIGRIGKKVVKLLEPFNPKILACDLIPDLEFGEKYNLEWVDKETIFKQSDVVSLHIPANQKNENYLDRKTISLMKTGSFFINTSRGRVVDEDALYDALIQKHLYGAALDVFKHEPYSGKLTKLDNVIFTAHMGASARTSRYLMELGAAEDCIRALKGEQVKHDAIIDYHQYE